MVDGKLHTYAAWTDKKQLQRSHKGTLCYWSMPSKTKAGETRHVSAAFRIYTVATWVIGLIRWVKKSFPQSTPFVALEDYAMGHRRQQGHLDMAELAGTIKASLWELMAPYRTYDPRSVKLAMTGDGSADKATMINRAQLLFGVDLQPYIPEGSRGDTDKIEKAPGPAADLADAMLIAGLLDTEIKVKEGLIDLKDLKPGTRSALLRTTSSNPVALVTRAMVHMGKFQGDAPTLATMHIGAEND